MRKRFKFEMRAFRKKTRKDLSIYINATRGHKELSRILFALALAGLGTGIFSKIHGKGIKQIIESREYYHFFHLAFILFYIFFCYKILKDDEADLTLQKIKSPWILFLSVLGWFFIFISGCNMYKLDFATFFFALGLCLFTIELSILNLTKKQEIYIDQNICIAIILVLTCDCFMH